MPSEQQLVDALTKADAAGDTASAQQFAAMIKQQRGGQSAPPAAAPAQPAPAQGQDQSGLGGGLYAALHGFEDTATFGQGDKAAALLASGMQHLIPGVPNKSYSENLADIRSRASAASDAHPNANLAGEVPGMVAGGGLLSDVLKAGRFVPGVAKIADVLTPVAGRPVANVARSFAGNAAIGTGIGLANGQPLPQAVQTGAISGIAAPIVGRTAEFAINKLQPAAQRAMQVLADKFGVSLNDLGDTYQTFVHLTGKPPSLAQLADLKTRGQLGNMANINATVGEAAQKAADIAAAPLHEQLAFNAGATRPQTEETLNNARDVRMDTMMNTPNPRTNLSISQTPVHDPKGLLGDPHIGYALQPNTAVNARLNQPSPILDRIQNGSATVGDVETIRRALRDQQSSFMRPAPGANSSRDPILAKEFGDIANQVENVGKVSHPDYGAALTQYRADSHYSRAFQHGLEGNPADVIPDGDTQLRRAIQTPEGQAGYEHGRVLNTAQAALESIAPGTVKPQTTFGPQQAGQLAAAAATVPSPWSAAHLMRAIPGLHLPEAVQQKVSQMLFDPRTTQQAIANLQRAGARAQDIRRLGAMIGGSVNVNISQYLSKQGNQ